VHDSAGARFENVRDRRRPMSRAYAGIGPRRVPVAMGELITELARALAGRGWVLRTGLSPGADQAFYRGARAGRGEIELYLPWPGFEAQARDQHESGVHELARPSAAAFQLSERYYRPWSGREWDELSERERARLARDAHEVLGAALDAPADYVVCVVPGARLDGEDPRAEGTGQALRIAADHEITVFNLARAEHTRRVRELARPA
jgi:hypothetical protein